MEAPTLLAVCCFFLSSKAFAVSALSVNLPDEVIVVNGGIATFGISYVLESAEQFLRIQLINPQQSLVFEATFSSSEPLGRFFGAYISRGSIDLSGGKTNFTITVSRITPDDAGQHTVEVSLKSGIFETSVCRLVVDFLPSKPSISGAPTQSVLGGAGPTVLICTANLGKPQASMVWSRRIGNAAYTDITKNVTMTITNTTDGTTNGTSILTVNLDTADDGVQFRCQVSNRQATLYAETEAVRVTETIMPTGSVEGGDTIKPTANGGGGDTIKPTANGGGGDTIKPTANGGGGVSAGRNDIPNEIVLGAAFVVTVKAYTTF